MSDDKTELAYVYLRNLLADGWEFPDAAAKAAVKFRIDVDLLRERADQEGA